MKLSLTIFAILRLSCALRIRPEARHAGPRDIKRTAQDPQYNNNAHVSSQLGCGPQPSKKPIPWWKFPNTDNGEMNALTGQQLAPFLDSDDDGDCKNVANSAVCPLSTCYTNNGLGGSQCGPRARCLKGYCQCNFGWKPAGNTQMTRGWTGLEALTVWTNTQSMGCTVRCSTLSCSEVPQVKGCFDDHVKHEEDDNGDDQGQGGLETDGLHLGAIKAPGADAGSVGQAI